MSALAPEFLSRPIAHRGLHDAKSGRIENSPSAFDAAIAGGYGIEMDLQLSSDGVAMVFHDDKLKRLTGTRGWVRERTAAELSQMTLTGGTDQIPTLADVLALVAGRVPLLIEIKDQSLDLSNKSIGPLEAAVQRDLASYSGPAAVMSFNPLSVAAFRAAGGGHPVGLTTCAFKKSEYLKTPKDRRKHLAAISDFEATGACFVSHDVADLGNPAVARLKSQDVPVLCWTVRSQKAETKARQVADNITFEGYAPIA